MREIDDWKLPDAPRTPYWHKVLLSLAAMLTLTLATAALHIPNPNMILITGLVVSTSLYGFPAGVPCALVMLVYSLYFFSTGHNFVSFTEENMKKMLTILFGIVCNTCFVGKLRQARDAAANRLLSANQILAESNALLEQASMVDALTGVRNRFAFQRDYPLYENQNVCVLMLDVDNFKSLNDGYGHKTGDLVLTHLGTALNDTFGKAHSYRYGGDEFMVVHNAMDPDRFGLRLREMLAGLTRRIEQERGLRVTFSAGYVYGRTDLPGDLRLMLRHADRKLYEAKHLGKNRAVGERFHRSLAELLA